MNIRTKREDDRLHLKVNQKKTVSTFCTIVIYFAALVLQFPFFSEDEDEVAVTKAILYSPLYIPDFISSEAEDCLTQVS